MRLNVSKQRGVLASMRSRGCKVDVVADEESLLELASIFKLEDRSG